MLNKVIASKHFPLYFQKSHIAVKSGQLMMRNQLQIESKQIPGTWALDKHKKI